MTVAVLAALTLIGAPSAAADRQGVWLTGHVQNLGWGDPNPDFVGTTGQSLRLEAIQLVDPVADIQDTCRTSAGRNGQMRVSSGRPVSLSASKRSR